jgi:hypothetical protein
MVQEGYAQHAQTQYDVAVMREDARLAEQQMVMKRQTALTEQQALQKYIQDNRGVLSPQQVADLQAQFEQRHGMPMGFDASAAIEAQRAVEETAMKRRASALSQMYGVPPEAAEEMLFVNPETGAVELTNYGQETIRHRQKEMDNQRLLDIAEQNAQLQREEFTLREREMGMKSQTTAIKDQEKAATELSTFSMVSASKSAQAAAVASQKMAEWHTKMNDHIVMPSADGTTPEKPNLSTLSWPIAESEQQRNAMLPGTIFWYGGQLLMRDPKTGGFIVWNGQ